MLTSITSHLSIGVKLFPSRLPDSMKESLLDGVEQVEPAGQQILEELPVTGVDKEMVSEALAQTEAVLFGLAIEKRRTRFLLRAAPFLRMVGFRVRFGRQLVTLRRA